MHDGIVEKVIDKIITRKFSIEFKYNQKSSDSDDDQPNMIAPNSPEGTEEDPFASLKPKYKAEKTLNLCFDEHKK
jgi:hypothetical protein